MSSLARKNIYLSEIRKQPYISTRPALTTEGVSRSSRHVARDAMDAVVPQGVRRFRVRSSRVVLAPRRWCQALSMMIDEVTGANKPDTPGRARSKP